MKQSKNKRQKTGVETFAEAAERISKLGPPGPPDLSYNLDHYLYGAPKKKLPKEFMKKTK